MIEAIEDVWSWVHAPLQAKDRLKMDRVSKLQSPLWAYPARSPCAPGYGA